MWHSGILLVLLQPKELGFCWKAWQEWRAAATQTRERGERFKLRANTDEGSYRDAVCPHNKTFIHTHTHTHTDINKLQTPQECAGDAQRLRVTTYSLFDYDLSQQTENRIWAHTNTHNETLACRCWCNSLYTEQKCRKSFAACEIPTHPDTQIHAKENYVLNW